MIYVNLKGGLGNQCFQYAAGRALSLASGQPMKLDLSSLSLTLPGTTPRRYELGRLRVDVPAATPREMRSFALHPSLGFRVLRKLLALGGARQPGARVLRYPDHRYRPLSVDPLQDTCLDGHWASEKYFAGIAADLRRELSPREEPGERNAELLARLPAHESASVHVRRGDYVNLPQALAFHGLCDESYYRRAAGELKKEFPGIRFHVFSDDTGWCRANLGFLEPAEFIEHNGAGQAHWDLRLMSACRHHIVANSSLSWWGAWLDPKPGKRVLAPLRWFSPESGADDTDVVPDSWMRI